MCKGSSKGAVGLLGVALMAPTYPCLEATLNLATRVFHENTFSKEKVVHTLKCPSGGYISQIQKLFLFG